MTCQSANQVLNPSQTIINSTDQKVKTLENQSKGIKTFVSNFRDLGENFDIGDISPEDDINNALEKFTSDAICASSTDIGIVDDFVGDCLNDALRGIKKYVNDIFNNIADGTDLISDIFALPEKELFKLMQQIKGFVKDIKDLISGIDIKINCILNLPDSSSYVDQIQELTDRIDTVKDDLYLADDGSFDSNKLTDGFDANLQTNILAYNVKTDELESEIKNNADSVIDTSVTVNPKKFF